MKRLLFIILILMLAWNAYAIPPTPPVAAGDGSGDVLAGTMGSTGQYCTKNAATKTIDCNTTPSYQAALDIAKGTYTNTYLCKYTSSGTLLDCNVDPAGFQTADADLTALAGLTSAANAIPYFTGSGTAGVISSNAGVVTFLGTALGAADSLVGVNSAGTALEYKTSLSISSLNLTSATSSIPMVVGTGTASGITSAGQLYFESDTDTLTIGDGTTGISLDMTANTVITFPTETSTLQKQVNNKIAVFTWDGNGTALTAAAGTKRCAFVPAASTLTGLYVSTQAESTSDITIAMDKDAFAAGAHATTDWDIIASDQVVTIPSAGTVLNVNVTEFTATAISAGDQICATITATDTTTWLQLTLYGTN